MGTQANASNSERDDAEPGAVQATQRARSVEHATRDAAAAEE